MNTIWETVKGNFATLLITTTIAFLTVFSDKIVGDIKFAVNRADLRTTHYEMIAADISSFTFNAEIVTESYDQGWTTKSSFDSIAPSYNEAIVKLRKQEYVTLALLTRFWKKDDVNRFTEVMETVKKIDAEIHSLNPEAEAVVNGTKPRADPTVTKPATDKLKMLIPELRIRINNFISNLI